MICLKHILFSFSLPICLSSFGQNTMLALDKVNSNEMTGSFITALNTDHKGYLWVGTSNGLNRYDGYNFLAFRSYKNDSTSLSHPTIRCINQFSENELLIGTANGLNAYSFEKNNFMRVKMDTNFSNHSKKNKITCLAQLNDGRIIVGTQSGLMLYDLIHHTLNTFNSVKETVLNDYAIQSMCTDKKGDLWLGTKLFLDNGGVIFRVFKYTLRDKKLKELVISEYGSSGHVGISVDHTGTVWVAIDDGLMSLNPQTFEKKFYKAPYEFHSNVSYFHSKGNEIYQGYWSFGVTVFDIDKKTYTIVKNDPDNNRTLVSNKVWSLFKDEYDVIWYGTDVGLQKQSNKRPNLEIIKRNAEYSENTFTSNQMLSIWHGRKNKDKLFIGIDGNGFSIYDKLTRKTENHNFGQRGGNDVEERFLGEFFEGEDGSVYAAGQYNFMKINIGNGPTKIKHYFFQQQHHFTSVLQDFLDKNILWIGSIGQVLKFNMKTETFEFIIKPNGSSGIFFNGISNASGTYFTSQNSLLKINADKTTKLISVPDAGNITAIEEYDKENILLGTSFLGLIKYNVIKNTYELIKNNKNNFFAEIRCIKKIRNTFWIGTLDGLFQYYPFSKEVLEYNLIDGLPSNVIQNIDYFEGYLYLATTNGMVILNPNILTTHFTIPKIDITSIIGIGNDVEIITNLNGKEIEIPEAKNSFKINFTALDFNLPEKNSYRYKLLPIQKVYKNNNHEHYVSFNELNVGEYEFHLIGSNSDNTWNTEPVVVKIRIVPPFYRSTLFYFILGFFAILIAGSIFYIRYRRVKNNQAYLEKTIKERTAEISVKQKLLEESNAELQNNNKKIELAYETLSISESKFKQITETIDDVFYLYNIRQKKYEYISPNCLSVLGLPQQYFYDGNSAKIVVHNDDLALVVEANVKIDSGISYDIEYRILVDGHIKWIAEKSSPIHDQNGVLIRNSGICRDITLNKKDEEEIRKKNKDITDSILYAQKIQKAFLVGEKILKANLSESFIYFKPKEKVSGDFFWIGREQNYIIITAGDCTGHGVPGALLSVIGTTLLNKIIHENKVLAPGKILTELNQLFYRQLTLDENSLRDGMDVSIITIDLQNKKVFFSGARNNGSMIANEVHHEFMAQRETIGENENVLFETKEVEYNEKATYYLYSDGYKDQFGGPNAKKLASKAFKDILVKSSKLKINEQEDYFGELIKNWQGSHSQTDDRLIIGFKLR